MEDYDIETEELCLDAIEFELRWNVGLANGYWDNEVGLRLKQPMAQRFVLYWVPAGIQCDGEILPTCEDVVTYAGLDINDITIATMPTSNSDDLPNTDLLIVGTYLIDSIGGFAISANFTIVSSMLQNLYLVPQFFSIRLPTQQCWAIYANIK